MPIESLPHKELYGHGNFSILPSFKNITLLKHLFGHEIHNKIYIVINSYANLILSF